MPLRRPLIAVLTALAAALAVAASPAAASQVHGIQVADITGGVTDAQIDADLSQARALHAKVVRTGLDWAELEKTPGQYDPQVVARADAFFAAAAQRHLKVLLVMVGTPCWNTTAPAPAPDCATPEELLDAGRYQPRDLARFADVASFVARRWGPRISAFEVWNEPDQANELYWAGADKVARYAELLRVAYPAIKQASPSTKVLAGALVGGNGKFLEALYQDGIKGSYDALSLHFYDLAVYQLGTIRQTRAKYHDKKPIWLAETGFTSCLTKTVLRQLGGHLCVSRTNQARFTLDLLRELRRERDVAGVVLFKLRDDTTYDFGALDRGGRRKPLYTSLRAAFAGRYGKARRLTLRLRASKGRVVASGSGPVGDAYVLEAYKGSALRYTAAFRLDRNARYALRLPKSIGRRLTVRVYPYTLKKPRVSRRIG